MRNLLIVILFIFISCENSNRGSYFIIEGHLESPNATIPVYRMNVDLISYTSKDTIKTDENGDFKLVLDIKEPGMVYLRLPNGVPADVFAEPNKTVKIVQKANSLDFGESNSLQEFMHEIQKKYYTLKIEFSDDSEMTQFYNSLLSKQKKKLDSLKNTASKDFIDYLKYLMDGLNFSNRYNYLSRFDSIPNNAPSYEFMDKVSFSDENALLAKEYINMQIRILPSLLERQGKDFSLNNAYAYLGNQIQNKAYLKYAQSIFLLFNYSNLSNSFRLEILKEFEKNYMGQIPEPIQGMLELMPGKAMFNFELRDNKNNLVTLSGFKNKIVLIDFWATWCGPCIKEEPFIYEIATNYPELIKILSINMDESQENWLNHIEGLNTLPNIFHFNSDKGLGSEFAKQFYLTGLPRYILIGKNNIIIDAYAPYPSSEEINKLIQANL